ncbi:hypothetical protein [Roseovarius sp. E0-M6]|uniref:hypothetical protein n=1 Tax=Roseovarius sp. E0-M6 TaxID=3127118 RepID=UPI00301013CF
MALSLDMQRREQHRLALRPGLRLDPMLEQGKTIPEEETDAVIRAVLTENTGTQRDGATRTHLSRPEGRRALPDLATQGEMRERAPRRALVREAEEARRTRQVAPPVDHPAAPAQDQNGIHGVGYDAPAAQQGEDTTKQRDIRKWMRVAVLGVVALIVVLRPLTVLLAVLTVFWVAVIGIIALGRGNVGDGFGVLYRGLRRRDGDRAERFRMRLDRLAERWDGVLDRIPGTWADCLALPDFSEAALDPDMAFDGPDPFDRLERDPQS